MAVIVNRAFVTFGGSTNQVGVFDGQNIQNGWDSHGPNMSVVSGQFGPFSQQYGGFAQFNNSMIVGQMVLNQSAKNNLDPQIQGP